MHGLTTTDHAVVDAARVHDRLWVGSHPPVRGHRCFVHHAEVPVPDLVACGFTTLVLCSSGYQPTDDHFPDMTVVHAPFDDDQSGLDEYQLRMAMGAVEQTVEAHDAGSCVLVTCTEGRNRSALVAAFALSLIAGISAQEAGEIVREKRGLGTLTNLAFREILATTRLER